MNGKSHFLCSALSTMINIKLNHLLVIHFHKYFQCRVKSVRIRSYSGPNLENVDHNNSSTNTFHAVLSYKYLYIYIDIDLINDKFIKSQ